MSSTAVIALIIFVITYIGIMFNHVPMIKISRSTVAFAGAVFMILFGVTSFDNAISYIDFNTIALLLGMMIIISTLKIQGFFSFIANKTLSLASTRTKLLVLVTFITGFASAFLVNDAVVLLFTPIIISICKKSNLNPIPFLLAEMLSANTGSVMTMTGNPQNMLLGISSGVSYFYFLVRLLPIAVLGMAIIILFVKLFYKKTFADKSPLQCEGSFSYNFKDMRNTLIIFCLVIAGFFFGKIFNISIPLIALSGAALTILFSRAEPEEVLQGVDWSLLLFFASLFIIVSSVKDAGLLDSLMQIQLKDNLQGIIFIYLITLVFSQILSNVPYTVLMLPLLQVAGSEILYLHLAASSTIAGNLTIVGAMANLIVIEQAAKDNVRISAKTFLIIGLPSTIITLALSILLSFWW
ncbi:MAG: hypothetical protein HUK18_07210 [Bacteroidales bacterium]|nr:hypothetical protein [Bacteroidales bacterium]